MTALLAATTTPEASSAVEEFDFGPVLARGQELRHEFPLHNPTSRPIRLLSSEAHTPCCSAVGPLPKSIPPGGTAIFPIVFKPGHQSGSKRIEFLLQTDQPDRPVRVFAVTATLSSELEITTLDGSDTTLPLGRSGHQRFRVVCRRIGDEGKRAPETVTVPAPLSVTFTGPAVERTLPGGLIETTRDLEVALPAGSEASGHQGELTLQWVDSKTWSHAVAWQVVPRIRVFPSGLVLKPSTDPIVQTLLLQSDEQPFRVLKAAGPLLAQVIDLPDSPARLHRLRLMLDPSRVESEGTSDVLLTTDHPHQPTLTVSVMVLAVEKAGDR